MKKTSTLLLCIVFVFLLCSPAFGTNAPLRLIVQGNEVEMTDPPIALEGRTLLPLRILGESLGARVIYQPTGDLSTQDDYKNKPTVLITTGSKNIVCVIGTPNIYKVDYIYSYGSKEPVAYSTELRKMDTASVNLNNTIYIPIRDVAELLGYIVSWDEKTQTISLNLSSK